MADVVQMPRRAQGQLDPSEVRALVLQVVVGNLIIALIKNGALEADAAGEMLLGVLEVFQDAAAHQRQEHPESAALWSSTSREVVGSLLSAVQMAAAQGAEGADDGA